MKLLEPKENINYNFIASMYAIFAAIGFLLLGLEKLVLVSYKELEGESSMKEMAESTEGLYLIFTPFIPCLLWSLIVRQNQNNSKIEKKKED